MGYKNVTANIHGLFCSYGLGLDQIPLVFNLSYSSEVGVFTADQFIPGILVISLIMYLV